MTTLRQTRSTACRTCCANFKKPQEERNFWNRRRWNKSGKKSERFSGNWKCKSIFFIDTIFVIKTGSLFSSRKYCISACYGIWVNIVRQNNLNIKIRVCIQGWTSLLPLWSLPSKRGNLKTEISSSGNVLSVETITLQMWTCQRLGYCCGRGKMVSNNRRTPPLKPINCLSRLSLWMERNTAHPIGTFHLRYVTKYN